MSVLFTVDVWVNRDGDHTRFAHLENVISFTLQGNSISFAQDQSGFVLHDTLPIDDDILEVIARSM
jgi:hypothetical protein